MKIDRKCVPAGWNCNVGTRNTVRQAIRSCRGVPPFVQSEMLASHRDKNVNFYRAICYCYVVARYLSVTRQYSIERAKISLNIFHHRVAPRSTPHGMAIFWRRSPITGASNAREYEKKYLALFPKWYKIESHSYCERRIGNCIQAFEWYHFQWPWLTPNLDFKVTILFNVK